MHNSYIVLIFIILFVIIALCVYWSVPRRSRSSSVCADVCASYKKQNSALSTQAYDIDKTCPDQWKILWKNNTPYIFPKSDCWIEPILSPLKGIYAVEAYRIKKTGFYAVTYRLFGQIAAGGAIASIMIVNGR